MVTAAVGGRRRATAAGADTGLIGAGAHDKGG